MITKRGCFSTVFHEGLVFVFGGLNYTEKVLRKCERYMVSENKWDAIADMIEPRKNSSACTLTADTIYVFGGSSHATSLDSIEQYSISANAWTLLKIRMPSPVSFLTCFKVSQTQILLLGGSVKEQSRRAQSYKTNQVLLFDVISPRITKIRSLDKDLISMQPAFYDDGVLHLIDEDGEGEQPTVVRYDLS